MTTTKKKTTKKKTSAKKKKTTSSPSGFARLRKWVGTLSWHPAFGDLFRTVNRLALVLGWGILVAAFCGLITGLFLTRP